MDFQKKVVIANGSYNCKIGYSGDDFPISVIPSFIENHTSK